MNNRARWVCVWVGVVLLLSTAASLCYLRKSQRSESPDEIYGQRLTRGYSHAISQMREVHRQHPHDAATRYWLASLLIEDAKDQAAIAESISLLEMQENASQGSWISSWSQARKLQAYGRGLEMLAAEDAPLHREFSLPNGDARLKQFVADSLVSLERIDSNLRALRKVNIEAPPPTKEMLSGDEVREDLLALKNLLVERWAYVAEKEKQTGSSLDLLLAQAVTKVQPQMKRNEAIDLLTHFVASLEDGHTHLGFNSPRFSLPFRVIEAAEGLIVVQTAKDGLGIEVGDRLVSVEDEPAMSALEAYQKLAISSTTASRRAAAVRMLPRRWCEQRSYRMSVERSGQIVTTEVKTALTEEMPWSGGSQQGKSNSWIMTRTLAPDIAYMKVSTWWPPTHSGPMDEDRLAKHRTEIDAAMAQVKTAAELVLDLRGNAGGSDPLCTYLASYFVPDPMKTYVLRYRIPSGKPLPAGSDGFENAERKAANYPRQPGAVLNTRLWVIMDEGCFSATDTLLNVFTRNIPDRVVTIGRANGAGIGGPNLIGTLRNSGLPVTCSTCKVYSAEGDLLEGHPIQVDHPVQWTRDDIIVGKDADLEAAMKLIGSQQASAEK
jgi:C-terminal processing protease CtpA/Prc